MTFHEAAEQRFAISATRKTPGTMISPEPDDKPAAGTGRTANHASI